MSLVVKIPDPLAAQVEVAAKSRATSAESYVIDTITKSLIDPLEGSSTTPHKKPHDPFLGLLADAPEIADIIASESIRLRSLPMRASGG